MKLSSPCMGILVACVMCVGCRSIGPSTIPRDRFDYSTSITESWKRQNLLNIIKMRYLDPPIFVDVGQIVAGYSWEVGGSMGRSVPISGGPGDDVMAFGVSGKYTDRPTITYTPLTGNKFVKGLMTPLPPDALFFLIQSGWPADGLFMAGVAEVNGLKNQESTGGGITSPDPQFLRVLELLRKIQISGAVGLQVIQDANKNETTVVTFRSKGITDESLGQIHELRSLLNLDPDASEFQLVFGAVNSNNRQLAVRTRSMMHVMQTLSSQVDVPAEHVAEHRTVPGWSGAATGDEAVRLIRIHSSKEQPKDSYASVKYRGHWFWIDDQDLRSKRSFAFTMMLFTLAETGEREKLPLITIPAQ